MSLDETLKDRLDAMSDEDVTKELTEYLDSRKEPERMKIKVGELVHYSDQSIENAIAMGRAGVVNNIYPDHEYLYEINNSVNWSFISRLITTPGVRIPVNVTERPECLKGKYADIWYEDGSKGRYNPGYNVSWANVTHYMILDE